MLPCTEMPGAPHRGGPTQIVDSNGRAVCGAETRTCECGHKQQTHSHLESTGTRRGACTSEGCACKAFKGRPHMTPIVLANGRCRLHGGTVPTGVAASGWKHGGYSTVMPARMMQSYEQALSDPERLSLQHEIAAMRSLLTDALTRMRDHDGAGRALIDAAGTVLSARRDFRSASTAALQARGTMREAAASQRQAESLTRLDGAIGALERALDPATIEQEARGELRSGALVAERLVRSENTRLVELHNMLALEVVLADRHALVTKMIEAVERHVHDEGTRRAIRRDTAAGYAELTGRRDAPALDAGRD